MILAISDTLADVTLVLFVLAGVVTALSLWIKALIPGSIWLSGVCIPLFVLAAVIENVAHRDSYTIMIIFIAVLAVVIVGQQARLRGGR